MSSPADPDYFFVQYTEIGLAPHPETCASGECGLKVHGCWCYLYRAIDRNGTLVDVLFSEHRDMAAAQAFFRSAKAVTGMTPDRVTTAATTATPEQSAPRWAQVSGIGS